MPVVHSKIMKKLCGIYKITNTITGDFYIGQSMEIYKRFWVHKNNLLKNKHTNKHIQNSLNKYGIENFKFEITLLCESFESTRYEQILVDKWSPVYNIQKECVNSRKGCVHSEETKQKMSESHKGKIFSEEHKRNMSIVKQNLSKETRQKMSESHRNMSEETRKKMSISRKKRITLEETRKKLSVVQKERLVSIETRQRLSEAKKGKNNPMYGKHQSEETIKKISLIRGENHPNFGKHHTNETREKMSNAQKDAWAKRKNLVIYACRP